MGPRVQASVLAVAVLALPLLSGCLDAMDDYSAFDPDQHYKNPGVFEGQYRFANGGSNVLAAGNHTARLPEVVRLLSERPAFPEETGDVADGQVDIPMAIWRPEGLETGVPIIVDAGPYYEIGSHCEFPGQDPCRGEMVDDTIDYPSQSTPFLLDNLLPHGYAVVQLAVRGTGTAGGCMDLLGQDERADLDQAIRWLGEQPWSNGRIAMMGVSYDGSTPWEVAATGNPYLKTIVPTSGLPDIYDLMFHNGSAETRGAIMHSQVYWGFGFDDQFPQQYPRDWPDEMPVAPPAAWPVPPTIGQANGREPDQDLHNLLCPEALTGAGMGPLTSVTGERHAALTEYWAKRDHRDDVLANYTGSIFLVHGLQDWNVDPHSAIPFNAALRAKGLEMKEWYGQWGHANPDSTCAQAAPDWVTLPCRLDYAEVLKRWFDRHLKGDMTVDVGPSIQVQDNIGTWRNADSFPPADANWVEWGLDGERSLKPGASAAAAIRLMPPIQGGPSQVVELRSEPLADDLHLSGLPQLRMPFEVEGPGGELAAWLFDEDAEGNVRAMSAVFAEPAPDEKAVWMPDPQCCPLVGHAAMNLRYYAGGETPQTLQPGTRYLANIEFEPLEVMIPRGHRVTLWVFQFAYPEHQSTQTPSPVTIHLGPDALLRLPTVDVDPRATFPVPGSHFPARDGLGMMYVPKPVFAPQGVEPPVAVAAAGVVGVTGAAAPSPPPCLRSLPVCVT